MPTLIAGGFQQQTEAQQAMQDLHRAGFAVDQTTTFYLGSPGQHDLYVIGGDEADSPGLEDSAAGAISGTVVGGAIGIAVGIATVPVLGPAAAIAGAGVGAYMGSLYGGLASMDDKNDLKTAVGDSKLLHSHVLRQSGMLVAVSASASAQQEMAISIFRQCGATSIDRIDGTIAAGEWIDFNPLTPIHPVIEQTLDHA